MRSIVIIGSGLAGYTLARELRKINKEAALTIITRDPGRLYSKPMLSNALTRKQDIDQLATFTAEQMAEQLNAEIITNAVVTKISPVDKAIYIDDKKIEYSKLVLATGAKVIHPTLAGDAVDEVLSVNSLVNYDVFRQKLAGKKHVTIIGSGLIGCEFANDLISAGFKVDVASFEPWPIHRFLPEPLGILLQSALASQGVKWHMGQEVQAVNRSKDQLTLTLANKETITSDIVLSAIGIVPDLSLAKDAGLKTNKGIMVNEYLQTSDEAIYVLGDCTEVGSLVLPFVLPIMHCSRALAKTLLGEKTALHYPCMPVVVKTPSYPIVIAPPIRTCEGEWQIEIDEDGAKALFYDKQKQLRAFALTDKKTAERMPLVREIEKSV